MRFLFRWAFRIFLILVVLAVALVLLKDSLAKSFLEHQVRSQTGLDIKIARLEVGLFSPSMTLEGVKVHNAPEFGGSILLDLPELHIVADRSSLALGKCRLRLVRVHLNELHIVESRDGRTNTVALVYRSEGPSGASLPFPPGLRFGGIDALNLTLGRIRYSSLNHPGRERIVQLDLENEIITNIRSGTELHDAILTRLLNKGVTLNNLPLPLKGRER